MIITIDGPAGSGKSTVARQLAARLQVAYLDTGAMYRAVALRCIRHGVDVHDSQTLCRCAAQARIDLDCGPTHTRVLLEGEDVSEAIRTMAVNQVTPYVSRVPEIRGILVEQQRRIGQKLGNLVSEGRDQGSVVFPQADAKFFLDADLPKRAERRYHEMLTDGVETTYQEVLENLRLRDGNDQHQWAPLLIPGSAVRIDTTHMSISEVVDMLSDQIKTNSVHPANRPAEKP